MINAELSVALVSLTTLATMLYIGLGLFHDPSRVSVIWSSAFGVMMVASYGWVIAGDEPGPLRAASSAAMISAGVLVWPGLRAYRGAARTHLPLVVGFGVVSIAATALTAGSEMFGWVFRIVFAAAAAVVAAMIVELARLGPGRRDECLTLAIPSAIFVVFGVIGLVDGVVRLLSGQPSGSSESLDYLRQLNAMGSFVYVVCALVTLLMLTREHPSRDENAPDFDVTARSRLQRARDAGDTWWAVLEVRLDDPADLRAASSRQGFAALTDRFADSVRRSLPPTADLFAADETTVVALLPGSPDTVRQFVSRLLRHLTAERSDGPLRAVRLSASVGWADVGLCGHDLEALRRTAHVAVLEAHERGGDQWVRAAEAVVAAE